ncbi:MBL fold metallo-hydrolase [Fretibacter rubidus]|uniref:MBL fold metallo-hydrolase n=1 Tax=Fretibacter rubidus TaxID=570162 RepID=UPI00352A11CB
MPRFITPSLITLAALLTACSGQETSAAAHAEAQAKAEETQEAPKPVLSFETIGENLHVIFGSGGNVGVSTGEDGIIIIDDKFERNAEEILSTLKTLSDQPLRYVLNTHYHGDHTGSNIQMKETGATIMAHDNVRKRMGMTFENKVFGRVTEARDPESWPTLTFSDTATLYFNGHQVNVIHAPNAHTDGDSIIKFVEANVIHMGDNYFNGLFPYVDVDGGGSLNGMIAAHSAALDMADGNTKIIPGHGPMATKADLEEARALLMTIKERVELGLKQGKSADDLVNENILQDYSKYASFINEENMIRIAYRSLSEQ